MAYKRKTKKNKEKKTSQNSMKTPAGKIKKFMKDAGYDIDIKIQERPVTPRKKTRKNRSGISSDAGPSGIVATTYIAGQFVDSATESSKAAILRATQKLMKTEPSVNYNIEGQATETDASLFLNMLGAAVCATSLDSDFSLLDIQTQEELSENLNIFDEERAQKLKKEDPKLNDKFPSKDDPIYELDERMTEKQLNDFNTQTVAGQEAQTQLGGDIAGINMSPEYEGQLTEFESEDPRPTSKPRSQQRRKTNKKSGEVIYKNNPVGVVGAGQMSDNY